MSRWDFMRQLEELLSDISPAEREEALQYYNDYFNDAGRENEQEVIAALGSPAQVAKIVKDGLDESNPGEFTENGFVNSSKPQNEVGNHTNPPQEKEKMPTWAIVLLVIGGIILSPVIFGILTSIAGTLFGLIVAALAIAASFILVTIVLFVVAVILLAEGFGSIFTSPLLAVGLVGAGCICAAVAILFMLLVVLAVGKGIPALIKGIQYLYHKLTEKKGEQA